MVFHVDRMCAGRSAGGGSVLLSKNMRAGCFQAEIQRGPGLLCLLALLLSASFWGSMRQQSSCPQPRGAPSQVQIQKQRLLFP